MTRTSAKGMLQSIAEQAGCSPSTVSRVLNGCKKGFSVKRELEERILAIANSLDYHPNPFLRVMRANDSKIIAIFDPATNSSETLHKAKAAFIGRIRQAGYLDTGKYVSLYNQESYTLPFPVAAALLFDISDTSFLAFLERREIPYVVINGISREGGAAHPAMTKPRMSGRQSTIWLRQATAGSSTITAAGRRHRATAIFQRNNVRNSSVKTFAA